MAATQADLSRLDAILKDRPLVDSLQVAMNKATPLLEKFTQQIELSGRKGIFPVSFGVNEGIYARADKGTFGDSQVDAPVLAEVRAKFVYAIFEISGPTISASRDKIGSFEDALSLQLEQTIDGVKLDMARLSLGKSSGVICTVQSRTDADTSVVDNPFGLTYKVDRPVRNLLRKNMPIDIFEAAGVLKHLTYLSHNKPLSFREQRMLERARYLVISELAAVCRQPECNIEPRVEQALARACTKHDRTPMRIRAAGAAAGH